MSQERIALALAAVLAVGAAARIASFRNNDLPHGDIHLDYAVAQSVFENNTLATPIARLRPYPTLPYGFGHPQDQHAPLWPLLGGLGAHLFSDPYRAFKVGSWIAGLAAIALTFRVGATAFGPGAGLLAAALVSLTWVLSDYSGNGSLYMLHAALYLGFLALLAGHEAQARAAGGSRRAGAAWLLNYQAAVLLPALVTAVLLRDGWRGALRERRAFLVAAAGVALLVASPWLVRNAAVFGSPLYNVNDRFVATRLGVPSEIVRVGDEWLSVKRWEALPPGRAAATALGWTAANAGYAAVRLWLLAPVACIFAALAAWRRVSLPAGAVSLQVWGLLSLAAWHTALSCVWPEFKFRYFVPLLPLVSLLAADGVVRWTPARWRRAAAWAALGATAGGGALMALRVPQHTAYYDPGEWVALRPGEADWQRAERALVRALGALEREPPGALLGPIAAYYHTGRPVVEHRHPGDVPTLAHLMERFAVRYAVVAEPEVLLFEREFDCRVLARTGPYATLRCPPRPR